jgi:flavin reductase (DIM6/NTAB) family NADH-FMN oxidoreductase RutF
VAVVATREADGTPAGLTTNAVSSLSLDPLLLLVCFDNGSRTLEAVRRSGRFAVSVLAAGQDDLVRTFARKDLGGAAKFEAVAHHDVAGSPVLDGALAWVACAVHELLPGGDHTIGVGRVLDAGAAPDGAPLLFFRGALLPGPA